MINMGKDWQHADEIEKMQRSQGRSQGSSGQPFGSENYSGEYSGDFSDFFGSMFGNESGSRGRQTKFRCQDIQAGLTLQLTDVYKTQKNKPLQSMASRSGLLFRLVSKMAK